MDKTDHRHWENREWLLSCDVPKPLLEAATKLGDEEKRLREYFALGEEIFAGDRDELLHDIFAENLRASYAIERENLSLSHIKAALAGRVSGQHEADAVAMTLSFLNDDALTNKMITEAHGKLQDIPFSGRYRQGNEEEIIRAGKEIVYFAPPPYLVRGLMDDFLGWWNDDRKNLPPIIGSAIGHSIFVIIHPFGDGNGRVSRAITEKGMDNVFPPYALSKHILENQGEYYKALQSVTQTAFVGFMLKVYEEALEEGFEKARLFQFYKYYVNRASFSENERNAIRKMVMEKKLYWQVSDFEDAWDSLRNRNVITDTGAFNAEWRTVTKFKQKAPLARG